MISFLPNQIRPSTNTSRLFMFFVLDLHSQLSYSDEIDIHLLSYQNFPFVAFSNFYGRHSGLLEQLLMMRGIADSKIMYSLTVP